MEVAKMMGSNESRYNSSRVGRLSYAHFTNCFRKWGSFIQLKVIRETAKDYVQQANH